MDKSPESQREDRTGSPTKISLFLIVVFNLLFVIFTATWLSHGRESHMEALTDKSLDLVRIIESSTTNSIRAIDIGLTSAGHAVSLCAASRKMTNCPHVSDILSRFAPLIPEAQAVFFATPEGVIVHSYSSLSGISRQNVDISERAYYKALRDDPSLNIYISAPQIGKITKRWAVNIAVPVRAVENKSTMGYMIASLDLTVLQKNISLKEVGVHGGVSIRDEQMGIIVRHPSFAPNDKTVGDKRISRELSDLLSTGVKNGQYRAITPLDGEDRIVSFQHSSKYPFYVNVGLSVDEGLATWDRERDVMLIIMFSLIVASTLAGVHLHRLAKHDLLQLDLRKAAEIELQINHDNLERIVSERTADLISAKTIAEDATRAKSAFLSNMSHEIRTPLNAITGLAHLLSKTPMDAAQRDRLDKIRDAASHLLEIVNSILDLSKIEAGSMTLESAPLDIESLVKSVKDMFQTSADNKGIVLSSDVPHIPPLLGDPMRIRQMLINYLSNAIKFTPFGNVTISVVWDLQPNADVGTLTVSVSDTGIGIDNNDVERLFSEFEQADTSVSRMYGGTGLGLAICRRISELSGGSVGARGTLGNGSTFWFSIPLKVNRTSPQEIPAPVIPQRSSREEKKSATRILVVDDEPINREIVKELLQDLNFDVDDACDAADALSRDLTEFDLILMDMQMPGMDGLSATRVIRAIDPPIPVLIVGFSANTGQEDVRRCMDAGMDGFVGKPVDPDKLGEEISKLVRREI